MDCLAELKGEASWLSEENPPLEFEVTRTLSSFYSFCHWFLLAGKELLRMLRNNSTNRHRVSVAH